MVNSDEILALANRLREALRAADSTPFLDELWGDGTYDYATTACAIQSLLEQSGPEDWRNAARWFTPEVWTPLHGWIEHGSAVEEAVVVVMRRWLSDPRWAGEEFVLLRSFADDFLYFRRPESSPSPPPASPAS
jgi:hypothetical protein